MPRNYDEDDEYEGAGEKEPSEEEKAVYACKMCKEMYKEPGMCPNCDMLLKKKGQ